MTVVQAAFARLLEYARRVVPHVCECMAPRVDPNCPRCDGNGEHLCLCVGTPLPDGMACALCSGADIVACIACAALKPDPGCESCRGTGARRGDATDANVACVVAGGLMDLLCSFRAQEAFHLYDEVITTWASYISHVREVTFAADAEGTAEGVRIAQDVLEGIADHRQYRSASTTSQSSSLTPHEQFTLLGAAPEGAFPCRNCGDYTMGFFYAHSPQDWLQDGRVACCSKDACIDAWEAACRTAGVVV